MKDITSIYTNLFSPKSALVFYEAQGTKGEVYVEHFDMDKNGIPINAHPLTTREANRLAKSLITVREKDEPFLKMEGILSNNVLHVDPKKGEALWFTKAMRRELFFTEKLGIANGLANVPPMLWKATRQQLYVFGLRSNRRPTQTTKLYNAPFFNVYENGNVCMGNVDIAIKKSSSLNVFTSAWEQNFFNSYFSHLMQNYNPIEGNCVLLWDSLVNTHLPFPMDVLKRSTTTLNQLL
ncbi:PRTRC system protein B [Sphingobacterium sp. MYb388]|uniref:PRTRC system protein B n=1 Tax=Sphingobacterium sp. MYb388 TaxID=2745437 RepID=UPI0030A6B47E